MPELDGLRAAERILSEPDLDTAVLMLTTFDRDEYIYRALRIGASGFLLKDAPADRLLDAVRVAAAGDALLAPSVTRRLIEQFARSGHPEPGGVPSKLTELTPRELEVLRHVAHGLSNAEIAEELVLGENTVKTHVAHVLSKLGLRDRVQAVVLAYETGFVAPDLSAGETDTGAAPRLALYLRERLVQAVAEVQGLGSTAQREDLSNVRVSWNDRDKLLLASRDPPGKVEQQRHAGAVQVVDIGEIDDQTRGLVSDRVRDGHLELGRIRKVDLAVHGCDRDSVLIVELELCQSRQVARHPSTSRRRSRTVVPSDEGST